jgi:hypothetical protein
MESKYPIFGRPYKSILVRTVANGGSGFCFCGPAVRRAIVECPIQEGA